MKYFFTLVLILFIGEGHAAIYKWVDENGNVHFSQNTDNVPENIEVSNVQVRKSNSSKTSIKKEKSNIRTHQKKKYSPAQLDKKCKKLSRKAAMDPNGLSSSAYREFRKLGC
ncbi:DUF4124 domain-containing protein [Psychromonas aquimarina]|uniref:DUF4124 domain-containing protein n=1 Tax=Psychromonas aquimarina TaxID=444919 RepID=UPI00048EC1B2|nr:DUF4124 domain-containing protein [Psychromonas aquimarina]